MTECSVIMKNIGLSSKEQEKDGILLCYSLCKMKI